MDITQVITEAAAPGAEAAGLIVDSVHVSGSGKKTVVVVNVDLPEDELGSAGMDAVSAASVAIGAALDDVAELNSAYTLEVGTPGLSRPLTLERHFKRARTRLIKVDLNDGTSQVGRLVNVTDGVLVFEDGLAVSLSDVAQGSIEVEMRRKQDIEGESA